MTLDLMDPELAASVTNPTLCFDISKMHRNDENVRGKWKASWMGLRNGETLWAVFRTSASAHLTRSRKHDGALIGTEWKIGGTCSGTPPADAGDPGISLDPNFS